MGSWESVHEAGDYARRRTSRIPWTGKNIDNTIGRLTDLKCWGDKAVEAGLGIAETEVIDGD